MSVYKTKQRLMLLNFLKDHAHKVYSVKQIANHFKDNEISTSAVYRNISELEKAGEISKITKTGTRESFYQYCNCKSCCNTIHLLCVKCEKSIHMDTSTEEFLNNQLLKSSDFEIDKNNTIIYGVCHNCKEK